MTENLWSEWTAQDHVNEAQRHVKRANGTAQAVDLALRMAQIHATLALTKAQTGYPATTGRTPS